MAGARRWFSRRAESEPAGTPPTALATRPTSAAPLVAERGGGGPALRYLELEAPQAIKAPSRRRFPWRLAAALPLLLTAAYLFIFASERHTAHATFVIRQGSVGAAAEATAGGLIRNDDSNHAVVEYFHSRAAARDLSRTLDLPAILGRPEGDWLTRFPRPWEDETRESLHRHLQSVIEAELDTQSGITRLEVVAYRPEDAKAVAEALLDEAESLVNAMNARANEDAVAFAEALVAEGEARVRDVQRRLAEFRNRQNLLDPNVQSAARLALMADLSRDAATLETEIAQLRSSAAHSPRLQSLSERRAALEAQIGAIRAELAGSSNSLAPKLSDFEMLALERDLAVKSLTASYRSLEQARQAAAVERLYLQRISAPNLSDRPSHPRTLRILLTVLIVTVGLYGAFRLLARVTMEHRP